MLWPSLEPSRGDDSNEKSQHMFYEKNMVWFFFFKLTLLPLLIWSSGLLRDFGLRQSVMSPRLRVLEIKNTSKALK